MCTSSPRRGIRARALAFLTLAATLAALGCGKDGGSGPTDPSPSDPAPSGPAPSGPGPSNPGPGPAQGPAPVGDVMYAVDLANNFLVFGSGSINVLTAKMKITGLPVLKRIIGITVRPSDGKLYGVGNDSRVYTIDPLTAAATPVGPEFTPKIASFFDIHFAMALEPNGERVRLIAAESGGNWSISLADGSATLMENVRYAAETPLAGKRPRLLGIVFAPYPDAAPEAGLAALSGPRTCEDLMYAIDVDERLWVAACDPNSGDYWPVGEFPHEAFERCGELMAGPDGMERPEGETGPPEDGSPWQPRPITGSPDTKFWTFLVKVGEVQARNEVKTVIPAQSMLPAPVGIVPSAEPIQTVTWAHGGPHSQSANSRYDLRQWNAQLSAATASEPPSDPGVRCGSA